MRADTAQEIRRVREMSISACVAFDAFREGLEKLFGRYHFVGFRTKPEGGIQNVDNPEEVELMMGEHLWKVPEGWPRSMLTAIRKIVFDVRVLELSNGNVWTTHALVHLDRYDHELRKGWEPHFMEICFSRKEVAERRAAFWFEYQMTPSGYWVATPGNADY